MLTKHSFHLLPPPSFPNCDLSTVLLRSSWCRILDSWRYDRKRKKEMSNSMLSFPMRPVAVLRADLELNNVETNSLLCIKSSTGTTTHIIMTTRHIPGASKGACLSYHRRTFGIFAQNSELRRLPTNPYHFCRHFLL